MAHALTDTQILNWLQQQVVDTIYLDDGRFIDVKGGSVRDSIKIFMAENGARNALGR